ncbi:MAG: TRAP transporter large permease [Rhodospirillales bacterium]|jgi:tripartite ATP-independent transporter DctM subunit|nr:C4-dicarboxylate ABC transporter permease [Rhodospirillaceae bacterium]MDP6643439.1 TRAP transporter large permease [Rhodospirillales bacterium]MDP6842501.1 TRAP transporter large permease [Rhodospirillales bacterium]
MTPTLIGVSAIAGLFLLIFLRVPIGIALAIAGVAGYSQLNGFGPTLALLGSVPFEIAYNYDLSIIALFVLMGNFAMVSGMSRDLYAMARSLVGHWPGGLASATVVGCAGFAAVSGSSLASAVTMGRVALPEMERYNYSPRLATGCVAAGGTLGILIPPSTGFIIYALLTEESIGQLFLAGVLPGILLTALFMLTIALMTRRDPEIGPAAPRMNWAERRQSLARSVWLIGIVVVVLGGIYVGVFTPVEAAAIGAFLTFILTLLRKKLSFDTLKFCTIETIKTFAMVYLIVIGAFLFSPFLALTEIPKNLAVFVGGLGLAPLVVLLLIVLGYIILGTFLEGIAIMVLSIPIVFPMILDLGFDPIWFGALLVVVLEMSLISPPLGLNVFVVKGIAEGVPMSEIFKGIIPFWGAMLVCAAFLIAFPKIALLLPETMMR